MTDLWLDQHQVMSLYVLEEQKAKGYLTRSDVKVTAIVAWFKGTNVDRSLLDDYDSLSIEYISIYSVGTRKCILKTCPYQSSFISSLAYYEKKEHGTSHIS